MKLTGSSLETLLPRHNPTTFGRVSSVSRSFWCQPLHSSSLVSTSNGETHKGLSDTFSTYHDYTVGKGSILCKFTVHYFWKCRLIGSPMFWLSRLMEKFSVLWRSLIRLTLRLVLLIIPLLLLASNFRKWSALISLFSDKSILFNSRIWPAGINGTAPGTIDWAGGMINWDDPDYKAAGSLTFVILCFILWHWTRSLLRGRQIRIRQVHEWPKAQYQHYLICLH